MEIKRSFSWADGGRWFDYREGTALA